MRIAVCLKFGLDVDEIKVDADTGEVRLANVPRKFGEYDYNALTEAACIAEMGEHEVVILVFGPSSAGAGLREAMAMGADRAVVIEDPTGGFSPTATSVEIISRAITKLGGFDLILCGEASIDGASYQFVPRLAERLQIPHIAYACKLSIENDKVSVERNLSDRTETLETILPVVVSVTDEINQPAKPTLMQVLKAKEKPVDVWTLDEDLGVTLDDLSQGAPSEQLKMRGIQVQRKGVMFKELSAQDAAKELFNILQEEGF